jgi:hypothetical protein
MRWFASRLLYASTRSWCAANSCGGTSARRSASNSPRNVRSCSRRRRCSARRYASCSVRVNLCGTSVTGIPTKGNELSEGRQSQHFVTCGRLPRFIRDAVGGSPHVTARSAPPEDRRRRDHQHFGLFPTVLPPRRRDMLLADHILRTYAELSGSRIRARLRCPSRCSSRLLRGYDARSCCHSGAVAVNAHVCFT